MAPKVTNTIVFNELSPSLINKLIDLNNQKFLYYWSPSVWSNEISSQTSRTVISYDGERLVGFALVIIDPFMEFGHLVKIATCPSFTGKGVGSRLLSQTIAFARQIGLRKFSLDVSTDNIIALKLYQAFNFKVLHERQKYYSDGKNSYFMELIF